MHHFYISAMRYYYVQFKINTRKTFKYLGTTRVVLFLLQVLERQEFVFFHRLKNSVVSSIENLLFFSKTNRTCQKIFGFLSKAYFAFYYPYDRAILALERRGIISRP